MVYIQLESITSKGGGRNPQKEAICLNVRMFVEFCGQNGSFLQHNYIMIAAHRVWLMAKHHTWPATSRSDPAADWSWKYVNWQNNGGNFASQQSTTKTWKCGSQHKSKIKVDYSAAASLFNFGMRLLVQSNNPPQKKAKFSLLTIQRELHAKAHKWWLFITR